MTAHAALNVFLSLSLMLVVAAVYVAFARRFRFLWHPLSIIVAVGIVGVVVSVLGELLFRGGSAAVPAMLRRSAIGSFAWGGLIAAVVWIARRVSLRRSARRT